MLSASLRMLAKARDIARICSKPLALTPTLSRKREREQGAGAVSSLSTVLGGEGWGEGAVSSRHRDDVRNHDLETVSYTGLFHDFVCGVPGGAIEGHCGCALSISLQLVRTPSLAHQ